MGACSSCGSKRPATLHEMYEPIYIRSSSDDIFGVAGYCELDDDEDCDDQYKNEHELRGRLRINKESLTNFFNAMSKLFPRYMGESDVPKVSILQQRIPSTLDGQHVTILIRMVFDNMASDIDKLLTLVYNPSKRKAWDVRLTDHFLV